MVISAGAAEAEAEANFVLDALPSVHKVSQMTNPEKVLAFLTLNNRWEPSLLLVMGAAVVVTFIGYRLVSKRPPLFDVKHHLPSSRAIGVRLMSGAAIFGVGWGLAGFCPGPAIATLLSGSEEPVIFLASMVVGGLLARQCYPSHN